MTNDLLDRKLERAFAHLDADRSGVIDAHDIIALGSRLLSALSSSPGRHASRLPLSTVAP